MKVKRQGLSLIVALLSVTVAVGQESKPNFSGSWTLDRTKSELGEGPGGSGGRRGGMFGSFTIEHSGNTFVVKRKMNFQGEERTQEARYTTDGQENTNEGFRGNQVKSKTYWEESKLITESRTETPNGTREIREVRTLSADDKVMTVEITIKGGQGEATRKLVYTKKE